MSDEDPVCPKPEIEESCKPKCVKYLLQYQVSIILIPHLRLTAITTVWHIIPPTLFPLTQRRYPRS